MNFDSLDKETQTNLNKLFEEFYALNDKAIAPEKARREPYHQIVTRWSIPLLLDPSLQFSVQPNRRPPPPMYAFGSISLLSKTLWTDDALSCWCTFKLADPENKVWPKTCNTIGRIGTGMDGLTGRGHGMMAAGLLDASLGMTAIEAHAATTTVKLEIEYIKPIRTPCVILLRSKVTKIEGSRCWVEGVIENGEGLVLSKGKGLMVRPRGSTGGKCFLSMAVRVICCIVLCLQCAACTYPYLDF